MEEQIANTLKQNIIVPSETTLAAPVIGDPDEAPVEFTLDELTQYKMSRHFGEDLNSLDTESVKQYNYIYKQVSEVIGSDEYAVVINKINDFIRMLGLGFADDSRQKLYQWLKLDNKRSMIETEMRNIV